MIQYYNPHFGFLDLIRTLFCFNSEAKLAEKFRTLTGKKHILFTSSCRSALYLAYKAIGKSGKVHTSPLTCKVALLPILATGNKICFHDVRQNDWTLDSNAVKSGICKDSIAIQAIHFGGFPCDIPALRKIADEQNLVLIEDCAQGYGSSYNRVTSGSLGDISCFTLTKNLFSLGGGVFATNNDEWYLAANRLQQDFAPESMVKIVYRFLMALVTTYRTKPGFETLYQFIKSKVKGSEAGDDLRLLEKELTKPVRLYLQSCCGRWGKVQMLAAKLKESAKSVLNELNVSDDDQQSNPLSEPSYTKLFIKSNGCSRDEISGLNNMGIEAMHLEHKHGVYYQEKLLSYADPDCLVDDLVEYERIHDRIISLPESEISIMSNYLSNKNIQVLGYSK